MGFLQGLGHKCDGERLRDLGGLVWRREGLGRSLSLSPTTRKEDGGRRLLGSSPEKQGVGQEETA